MWAPVIEYNTDSQTLVRVPYLEDLPVSVRFSPSVNRNQPIHNFGETVVPLLNIDIWRNECPSTHDFSARAVTVVCMSKLMVNVERDR